MAAVSSTGPHQSLALDPSWRPLYRAGALAAALAVILYLVALGLYVTTAAPPSGDGAVVLAYVHAHRTLYTVKQLLWIAPNLLMMVVVLALAVAHARPHKSFALLAGVIAVTGWAVAFAWPTTGEGSLGLVVLSNQYAKASTDAARASYVAGAELLLALNGLSAVILGVLQTLGLLLIALLMLRGPLARGLAWLGMVTGGLGIVAEALRPVLGWGYALYGLVLFCWLVGLAVSLWRLGSPSAPERASRSRTVVAA